MDFLSELRDKLIKAAEDENARRHKNVGTVLEIAGMLKEKYPEQEFSSDLDRVIVAFRMPKRDNKFIWLTAEEIFDLFSIRLEHTWHSQSASYFCLQATLEDVIIDLTFYFANSCVPIREEVTETRTVGYRCE